jgi:uncharacterized protein (TIRG00374 family)
MRILSNNIVKLLFSILLILALFYKTDINHLYLTIKSSNLLFFSIAILCGFLNFFISTYRWEILIKRFSVSTSFFELFRFICLSFFYNFFIPGGFAGDLIRGYKCKGISLKSSQGLASVFIDRLIGLAAFITFGLLGILFSFKILVNEKLFLYLVIVLILSILFTFLIFNRNIIEKFNVLKKIHNKLFNKLKELYEFIYSYKNSKKLTFYAFITSLGAGFFTIFIFFLLGLSINVSVPFVYYLFFIPIIIIVSYLPISYSGLGIREASFVLLFAQVGVENSQALAISLMYFGILLILGIVGGILFILTKNWSGEKISSNI